MNLLAEGQKADYIVTGVWSQKAVSEAKRVGGVNIAGTTEEGNFVRIPRQDELTLSPEARSGVRCPTRGTCRSCATPRPTSTAVRSTSRSTA